MANTWIYLLIATIAIFIIVLTCMFFLEAWSIFVLGNRIESSTIAAGWAGFSQLDLVRMAQRIDIEDKENREIYLNKPLATQTVMEYLKENLKLDDNLRALPESYIQHKLQPVIIEEITIYNPNELPAITSDGIFINRTTIHIVILIPIDIKFYGFTYIRKSVPVDIKSFLAAH